jgi:COP9 signalosome complex subunit 6
MEISNLNTKSVTVMEKEGMGSLNLMLHPLVIINISDHFTRTKVQNNLENPRVIGALLGSQQGRNIEITNSFELVYNIIDKSIIINKEYFIKKQEQFKKVFPTLEFLGWYSTSQSVLLTDIEVHKQFFDINENPLYLLLDPLMVNRPDVKEIPIFIFESELRMINDKPTNLFVKVPYKIETNDAERLAIDHVARITPTGSTSGSNLTSHLVGIHNAIFMLNTRIKILLKFLNTIKQNNISIDHGLLRRISSLCNQLPTIDTPQFKEDFLQEYNDALLIIYLASITKGCNSIYEIIDKFYIAFEKRARKFF